MDAYSSRKLVNLAASAFLYSMVVVTPAFAGHSHHEGMNMESHSSHQTPASVAPPAPTVTREPVTNNVQEQQKPQPRPKSNELLSSDEPAETVYEEPPERHAKNHHKKQAKSQEASQTSSYKKKSVQEMASEYYTDTKKVK